MVINRVRRKSLIGEGEVDLTPLIDCVFLLLIFFMVTTVFIDVQGLVIDLPTAADNQEEEQQQQKKDVNILISSTGEFTVAGQKVSSAGLAGAIITAMEEANNKNVIIQGDPEAKHSDVVRVMDAATGVGAEQMAFAIEQAEE